MLEYLRDPVWQFAGAFLALMAIVATVALHIIQRQRKRLAYDLVSRNQLLTVKEELESKLQVLFDGQPTRDICLLVVRIINNGNIAISSSDYEKEITIGTGTTSKILSSAITEIEPENLSVEIFPQDSSIRIAPVLLNPRDSISLKILVSDFSGKIAVDARIIGVKRIERLGESTGLHSLIMFMAMLGAFIGASMIFHFNPKPEAETPTPIEVKIGISILIASYLIMSYLSLRKNKFKLILDAVRKLIR